MADSSDTRNPSARKQLTAERLRELLHYDPETGVFTWRTSRGRHGNVVKPGQVAGTNRDEYTRVRVAGYLYRAHQLAWLYMTGAWPAGQIDHKNCNQHDNRWENLRLATNSQNKANSRIAKNNSSGFKGVTWNAKRQMWRARIQKEKQMVHIGYFTDPEEAHRAYCVEADKLFGEFSRAG